MILNTKKIFLAIFCAAFIFGFSVVSTVSADNNPFASNDSDTVIKLVGADGKCGGEGKCGS